MKIPQQNSLRLGKKCAIAAALAVVLPVQMLSTAANVSQTADDGFGTSSFNSAGTWDSAAAPTSGNDYFNAGFLLRTPADGNNYTFQGDSLTITGAGLATGPNNQALMYKGSASSTITVNNLTIDGGELRQANSEAQTFTLDGNLTIGSSGASIQVQGPTIIDSAISGSGIIRILDAGNDNVLRTVTFANGANTFAGNIELFAARSRFDLASTGNLSFTIGANGVNNTIAGSGVAQFDGIFDFDLSGASSNPGDSWSIANATGGQTFGSTFSVTGFTDNGSGIWSSSQNGAEYQFNTSDGVLSVAPVPEPGVYALLMLGCGLGFGYRRWRKI